jgi:hypothetical protein
VRYRGSDYLAPTTYGHRDVMVKGFVDQIIICDGEELARHKRSYERGAFVCDPLHYLALIEQKPNALDQVSYVERPAWQGAFSDVRSRGNGAVICSAFQRGFGPLASMNSAMRVADQRHAL